MKESERAAFEAWAEREGFNIQRDDSDKYREYHRTTTRWAWQAWLARAALGVKTVRVHQIDWPDEAPTYEVRRPGRGTADDYEQGECLGVFQTRAEAEAYAASSGDTPEGGV